MIELKEHNMRPFQMIADDFKNDVHSVIYVSGVGTGKSFIFMAVAESLFKGRILYVIPKHAITSNMKEYADFGCLEERVDFATYNQFTSIKDGLARIRGYDLVVIDAYGIIGTTPERLINQAISGFPYNFQPTWGSITCKFS